MRLQCYDTLKSLRVIMVKMTKMKVVVILVRMTLIGSGEENCVMISSVPRRHVLVHACFMSFQPKSMTVMCQFCYDPWFARLRLSENDFLEGGAIQEEVRMGVY
jgi:hypothetical protein